jgi:hypothetical protein
MLFVERLLAQGEALGDVLDDRVGLKLGAQHLGTSVAD